MTAPAPRPPYVDWIDSRLPKTAEVSTLDVASAFSVDAMTVDRWREAGNFAGQCFNKATGPQRERWWFLRQAVLEFAAKRVG